jgi:hypothetical protein
LEASRPEFDVINGIWEDALGRDKTAVVSDLAISQNSIDREQVLVDKRRICSRSIKKHKIEAEELILDFEME